MRWSHLVLPGRTAASWATASALLLLLAAALLDVTVVPVMADDGGRPASIAPATLLVDGGGRVIASTEPARFPPGTAGPVPAPALARVLAGAGTVTSESLQDGRTVRWSLAPVAGAGPAAAVYQQAAVPDRQAPLPPLPGGRTALLLAACLVTLGAGMGAVAMRGTVLRLRRLGEAAGSASAGDARREERRRIAEELHDSVSQDLFSLRVRLAGLELRHRDDEELRGHLAALHTSAGSALRHVRGLLLDLHPAPLDGSDVEVALRELGASCGSRLGIAVAVRAGSVELDGRAREALLRVAAEALANAGRHARATRVEVDLSAAGGAVTLRVTDDGRGLPENAEARGHGLRLARERLGALGGVLRLDSAPGAGTRLTVTLPAGRP